MLSSNTKNAEDNGDNFVRCNLGHRTSRCTHSPSWVLCRTTPCRGRTHFQDNVHCNWVRPLRVTHTGAVESITGTRVTITRNGLKVGVRDVRCCGRNAVQDNLHIFLVRGSCRAQSEMAGAAFPFTFKPVATS